MNPKSKKTAAKRIGAKPAPKKKVKAAATRKPPARRASTTTRTNRRSEKTIEQILMATIDVLMNRGSSKLFVREVCDRVGISRGTLYRYFASKEELLEAVVVHMRTGTDRNVNALVEQHPDPESRLDAFLRTLSGKNFENEESTRLLETEPVFLLNYLQHNFTHFTNRLDRALAPIYDQWDKELGARIDRPLLNEIFVRLALSKTIVPTESDSDNVLSRIGDMIQLLRRGSASSANSGGRRRKSGS
jgi:AcrR family transcriptional regulator